MVPNASEMRLKPRGDGGVETFFPLARGGRERTPDLLA